MSRHLKMQCPWDLLVNVLLNVVSFFYRCLHYRRPFISQRQFTAQRKGILLKTYICMYVWMYVCNYNVCLTI